MDKKIDEESWNAAIDAIGAIVKKRNWTGIDLDTINSLRRYVPNIPGYIVASHPAMFDPTRVNYALGYLRGVGIGFCDMRDLAVKWLTFDTADVQRRAREDGIETVARYLENQDLLSPASIRELRCLKATK